MNAWFPLTHQVVIGRRDNTKRGYLKSVWIGFTAMFLNLPYTLWVALNNSVGVLGMLIMVFKTAVVTLLVFPALGLAGALTSNVVTPEEARQGLLDEQRKQIEKLFEDDDE